MALWKGKTGQSRTMLNEEKIHDVYLREVVYTTVYILNRGKLGVNTDKTP